MKLTLRLVIGLILIFINQPFGWFSAAYFYKKKEETGKKVYYIAGLVFYILSWGMFFFGAYLVGKKMSEDTRKFFLTFPGVLIPASYIILIAGFLHKSRQKKKK